jgi:hypothetical protein
MRIPPGEVYTGPDRFGFADLFKNSKPTSQPYWQSSDTSNALGFGCVYFPFLQYGLNFPFTSKIFIKLSSANKEWYKHVCNLLQEMYAETGRCNLFQLMEPGICCGFASFLSRFGEWWQVRQSLQISPNSEFWLREDMRPLRDLAMYFRWNEKEKIFEEDQPLELLHLDFESCDKSVIHLDQGDTSALHDWLVRKGVLRLHL